MRAFIFNTASAVSMSANSLYTDLSAYYDLMCQAINYPAQSRCVLRLHKIFGNQGKNHVDLACGTGPHIQYFLQYGFDCLGLDINQPMLDIAQVRCPEAHFAVGDMSDFCLDKPVDLITCFLYSLHYCQQVDKLQSCFNSVHQALNPGGMFCFNAVDKDKIDNQIVERHSAEQNGSQFTFTSAWHYAGQGNQQALLLSIEKTSAQQSQVWHDSHNMVAVNFEQLQQLLSPLFSVHMFEHDYEKITPWQGQSGNAIFVCIKQ